MSLLTRFFCPFWQKNLSNLSKSSIIKTQFYGNGQITVKLQKFGLKGISNFGTVRKLNFNIKTPNIFFLNAFDKIFATQKYKQKHIGFLWYKTLDEVNREEFFNYLEMPDTFFSWFKVLELHVWMLMFQMRNGEPHLRYIRDGVVEAMWFDLETRAKMLEKSNKNIRKSFNHMYERFKMTLFWYDYGYLENDIILTNVVWNIFFERENDDPEKLEAMVRYIRYQMNHLQNMDGKILTENIKAGVWTSIKPHCKGFST